MNNGRQAIRSAWTCCWSYSVTGSYDGCCIYPVAWAVLTLVWQTWYFVWQVSVLCWSKMSQLGLWSQNTSSNFPQLSTGIYHIVSLSRATTKKSFWLFDKELPNTLLFGSPSVRLAHIFWREGTDSAFMPSCLTHHGQSPHVTESTAEYIQKGLMPRQDLEKLVHVFIFSRLDYCNGVFTGLSIKKKTHRAAAVD